MIKIIAVLIIMVVINLFMAFAVKKTSDRVDQSIKHYFIGAFSDSNFRETVPEMESVEDVEPENAGDTSYAAESYNKGLGKGKYGENYIVNYKNIDFKREYQILKEKMTFSKKDVVRDVIAKEKGISDVNYGKIADTIKKRFSFDMIFNINTLIPEDQLTILRETLLSEEEELLKKFLREEQFEEFNCVDFFGYVDRMSQIYDNHFYVSTGWKDDDFKNISDDIVMVYDSEICEGIKIMYQNKVYDYSI